MKTLERCLKESELFFIAGPCVIESEKTCFTVAGQLKDLTEELNVTIIFKSSYAKANRTSGLSFRGPGLIKGLSVLRKVKERFLLPVLTDVHEKSEVGPVAEVADIIQIPAFLCRQTELIEASAKTGRWVNIKKGQFMAPEDMIFAAEKAFRMKNKKVLITERGTSFGYHNLVVDFRGFSVMKKFNLPVIFDATHSVQLPGAEQGKSSGQREFINILSRCACAGGADGFFFEVHPRPVLALSDSANSLPLKDLKRNIQDLLKIKKTLKSIERR
ncbi:MAG: 3-deoxy-8-phosphooctulonate synthase [Candidatus Aureabacteria bacterium]|nr:3-deoxy-8-phosphooctulonate synthase [Candidatus Auribacterota bacterium]